MRPETKLREASHSIAAADHALPLIAARRAAAPAPELRRETLGAFTAPATTDLPPPPSAYALDASRGPLVPVLLARAWAHAARGPPLG